MKARHHSLATLRGITQTRRLLRKIEHHNHLSIKLHGDVNPQYAAELLTRTLTCPDEQREGVIWALAEFIAYALHGEVLMPETWLPRACSAIHRPLLDTSTRMRKQTGANQTVGSKRVLYTLLRVSPSTLKIIKK